MVKVLEVQFVDDADGREYRPAVPGGDELLLHPGGVGLDRNGDVDPGACRCFVDQGAQRIPAHRDDERVPGDLGEADGLVCA